MFVFKSILAISTLLCVIEANTYPPAENIVQCLKDDDYTVLYNQTLHADAKKEGVAVLVANFPGPDETNTKKITCLKITNLNHGDGAEVKTIYGGIDSEVLVAVMVSEFGEPLDYMVEILSQ